MQEVRNAAGLIVDDRESGIFRVHRSAFIDRDIFELERSRIFDRSWLFAGHASEFPDPGDFITRTVAGRRIRLFTRISDRPGGLATLLTLIAEGGGNVVHADHVREAVPLHVRETGLEIALETRGPKHGEAIITALTDAGYDVRVLDQPE